MHTMGDCMLFQKSELQSLSQLFLYNYIQYIVQWKSAHDTKEIQVSIINNEIQDVSIINNEYIWNYFNETAHMLNAENSKTCKSGGGEVSKQ